MGLTIYWGWYLGLFFYCGANAKHGKPLHVVDMGKRSVSLRTALWNARATTGGGSGYGAGPTVALLYRK